MRSYDETDEDDVKEAAKLSAEPWMLAALACNPGYVHWGPHEDAMWRPGRDEPKETNPRQEDHGWSARIMLKTWPEMAKFELDDLNECVNFYFSVSRDSKPCDTCREQGLHPDALWISDSFYRHTSPFTETTPRERQSRALLDGICRTVTPDKKMGYPSEEVLSKYGAEFTDFCREMRLYGCWNERITEDEVAELVKEGRLRDHTTDGHVPTATEVNAAQGRGFMGHDAINRWILIRTRTKRYGIPDKCPTCLGEGSLFTAPAAHMSLTLWWLHPRKGASRGIEVASIEREELPAVVKFLREAAQRNADRFAKLGVLAP